MRSIAMENNIDYNKIERSAKLRQGAIKAGTHVLLMFWAVLVLFPFYWMLLTSVKSYGSYNAEYIPQLITLSPTF